MGLALASPKGLSSLSLFPSSDAALHQSSPTWDGNLCVEVVVPHLWGYLKVAVVRVKVMVIIIEVLVRGQVSARKSCSVVLGPRWQVIL
jgi:hypothetical protein